MDPGSSPAITVLPDHSFEIAFQASDHTLWAVDGTSFEGQAVPGAVMKSGTTPSISSFGYLAVVA